MFRASLAQTMWSWFNAKIIQDSIMDVPDLNTKKDHEGT
jgi:hypothetical protein